MKASAQGIAEILALLVDGVAYMDDAEADACGIGREATSELAGADARSYEDRGIMTMDAGFVLSLPNGTEFQITVVRSA